MHLLINISSFFFLLPLFLCLFSPFFPFYLPFFPKKILIPFFSFFFFPHFFISFVGFDPNHPLIHSFTHSFTYSLIYSFTHLFIYLFTYLLIAPRTCVCIYICTCTVTRCWCGGMQALILDTSLSLPRAESVEKPGGLQRLGRINRGWNKNKEFVGTGKEVLLNFLD